jgi:hypothetical protein
MALVLAQWPLGPGGRLPSGQTEPSSEAGDTLNITGIPRYTRSHFTRFRYNAI